MQISFIITTYNNDDPTYLKTFLKTIFATKKQNFEVVIIDNSFEDDTLLKIINPYINKYPMQIQVITSFKPLDVASSRNIGIHNAIGKYLAFLHPTEIIDQQYFATVIPLLQKYPHLDCLEYETSYKWNNNYHFQANVLVETNYLFDLQLETTKKVFALISPFIATKLFRRHILLTNKIYFHKPTLFNTYFIYNFLLHCKSFLATDKVLIKNEINIINHNNALELVNQWVHILNYYNKKNVKKKYAIELEYAFVRYCLNYLIWAITSIKKPSLAQKVYECIKEYLTHRYHNFRNNPYITNSTSTADLFPEQVVKLREFIKPFFDKNKLRDDSKYWK